AAAASRDATTKELNSRTSRVDAGRRHDAAENICITWVKVRNLATGADIIYMPSERDPPDICHGGFIPDTSVRGSFSCERPARDSLKTGSDPTFQFFSTNDEFRIRFFPLTGRAHG